MDRKKKPRSLRTFVLAMVGIATFCGMAVFVGVFLENMLQMLRRAERDHVTEQSRVIHGALEAVIQNLHSNARVFSSRDDTYAYALGENPGYVEASLADGSAIAGYRADFVIIKDRRGRNLYVGSRYASGDGSPAPLPSGLTARIDEIAADVLRRHRPGGYTVEGPASGTGFVVEHGDSWLVCVMPILRSDESGEAAGTFTFAAMYGDTQIRRLTRLPTSGFSISERAVSGDVENEDVFRIKDGNSITLQTILPAPESDRQVVLRFDQPRTLYQNGRSLVVWTTLAMIAALIGLVALLFLFLERYLLRPLGRLIGDVGRVEQGISIDPRKYWRHEELYTLSLAIDEMLSRVEQSHLAVERTRVSMNVLQNILNGLDVCLFVSDSATDEILFVNDEMRKEFSIEGDGVGEICWKVLQPDMEERCGFCPCWDLEKDPSAVKTWEERNAKTGRYYRRTDRLIEWADGRKAHLQCSVNITDARTAELSLQKQFEQQRLMADISRSFISTKGIHAHVTRALEMTGEFMGIQRVMLIRYNAAGRTLECINEWCNPAGNVPSRVGCALPVDGRDLLPGGMFGGMFDGDTSWLSTSGSEGADRVLEARYFPEIPNYLTLPIFVRGELWGILDFGRTDAERQWTRSDIELARLVASLLSGVIGRQKTEEQLRRLSSIVQSSPQFISYITLDGRMDYVNPAASAITGYSKKELMEGGIDLIWGPETVRRIREECIPETLRNGEGNYEMELIRRDGEKRIMAMSSFTTGGGTEPINIGGIARDITVMRQLERDLLAAKDLAEQGSLAKSEFLSRMSHEMRTPMSAIIGMTTIARASDDPKKKEYCLEKIDNASRHLLGVINDILDMSKIEANKFELSPAAFGFEKMLMNVINVVNFRMDEKSQKLSVYVDPGIPSMLTGDEQRLAQIITNLLTNAVKFTPEKGHIGLSVRVLPDAAEAEDGRLTLQIEVDDDGIGISQEQQAKLFRSFEQADGSIARKFGGTGLGLAISKRIVELMDGKIWIESELGRGSKFIFTVKMERASGQAGEPARGVDLSSISVLAVDDSAETRDYFLHVMQGLGVSCRVASGGREALDLLKSAEKPFDIIFVDWKMPEVNGIELTRELRRQYDHQSIIIMISVAEWSEIEKEAAEAGVDGFVPKPLFPSLILDSINKYLGRQALGMPAPAADPAEATRFPGKTILLAEDVDINREIVITILEGTELTIECAVNGAEAVRMFAADPSRYDMIFMDVHMPEMDGLEATRKIRALDVPEAQRVPIIAMTANVFREDVERCLAAGMNEHIGKPIDFDQLFVKLSKYLSEEGNP